MISLNCLHQIKLLNIQENDVVPHQLLLIKGSVQNLKCCEEANVELSAEANILTTGLSKATGRFKFLLDLGTEDKKYELKFSYCVSKLVINIIYRKKQSIYKIQPLLILAKDEQEQSEKVLINQQIIDLNLLIIQSVYAEKLREAVKERLTFVYNNKCRIFISKLTQVEIYQLNEQDLWLQFAKELLESDWSRQNELKFIAFISCSKYMGEEVKKSQDFSYQNIRKHIIGHAALGAGGLALFSAIYFYSWPAKFEDILKCFQNQQSLDLAIEPDDSNYRKTKAGVYASSLGAVCHEIGHIFDLGHDLHGVMGSNFDYINRVFTLHLKTEHLPERIVETNSLKHTAVDAKPRFTCLKDPADGFLQRYREQHENDSFYFSANSALILSHHAWLRHNTTDFQSKTFDVDFDKSLGIIKSLNAPLTIVEIRACANSLVKEWFDLRQSVQAKPVFEFNLKVIKSSRSQEYYVIVMSVYGHIRKLEM